jgi:hypothetical protein
MKVIYQKYLDARHEKFVSVVAHDDDEVDFRICDGQTVMSFSYINWFDDDQMVADQLSIFESIKFACNAMMDEITYLSEEYKENNGKEEENNFDNEVPF